MTRTVKRYEVVPQLTQRYWTTIENTSVILLTCLPNVRFGSKADVCGATAYVRFTSESDCKSGRLDQSKMSYLVQWLPN